MGTFAGLLGETVGDAIAAGVLQAWSRRGMRSDDEH